MQVRIHKRRDDPSKRRWFAVIDGTCVKRDGRFDVIRVFFPWFYIDLLFQQPTT
jgi:hypothetical protein